MKIRILTWGFWTLGLFGLASGSVSAQSDCPSSILPAADRLQLGPEHLTGGEYRVILDPLANDRSTTGVPLAITNVEPGNPVTGQMTLNPEGTVTFEGHPGNVGTRIFFYYLQDESGEQVAGAITVQEGTAAACVVVAQLDDFTVPAGVSSHSLHVLANDATPGGCAAPSLVPFATPSGSVITARNGEARVDVPNQRILYSPPSLFYSGAADSFSYSVQGTAGAPVTTSVTVRFSGQASPASACSGMLGRTGLKVILDSHCSHPSSLSCNGVPAYLPLPHCWSFGDGGSLPNCDALSDETIYVNFSTNQLCTPPAASCYPRFTATAHTFSQPADYATLVRITDSCGQQDTGGTQVDLRNQPPIATIGQPSCWGLTCSLSAAASTDDYGIASYRWEFGHAGSPAQGMAVDHDFPALGTFRVALVIQDVHGATARAERDVTLVDQPPIGLFEWSCQDLSCTLTDQSFDDFPPLAEVRWRWKNRAMGTSGVVGVGSPIQFTAPVPGTYELSLLVTDSAGQPDPTPPVQVLDILGNLVAEPDWAALSGGQTTVDLPVLENDRSPVGGLQIVALKQPGFGTATLLGNSVRYTASPNANASFTDAFGYEVLDAAGNRAGGQIRVVRQPIAQVGQISNLSTTHVRVKFETPFSEPPVVFAMPVSRVYADPVSARVAGVDATGFTIFLQEPEGTADGGAHTGESVTWLAVLPTTRTNSGNSLIGGTATLEGIAPYAAGRISVATHAGSAGGQPSWAHIRFPTPLVGPDIVVLTQAQTENDPSWLTVRVDDIAVDGFRLAMQPREASPAPHGVETVAWLAVPIGVYTAGGGTDFEAGITPAVQSEALRALEFEQVFARPPLVVAGLASSRDLDPAMLRYRQTFTGEIELAAQEEASFESDLSHSAEKVAYLAFEEQALFGGSLDALNFDTEAGDLVVLDDGATFMVSAISGGPVKICPIENDVATAGGLKLVLLSQPRFGSVSAAESGMLTYYPAPGVCESVEVHYGVADAMGRRAYGTVYLRCGGVLEGADFGEAAPIGPNACEPDGEGGGEKQ